MERHPQRLATWRVAKELFLGRAWSHSSCCHPVHRGRSWACGCEGLRGDSEVEMLLRCVCEHCQGVWYCGADCQAAHWRAGGHREVCEAARGSG